jgi:hypothetical protein
VGIKVIKVLASYQRLFLKIAPRGLIIFNTPGKSKNRLAKFHVMEFKRGLNYNLATKQNVECQCRLHQTRANFQQRFPELQRTISTKTVKYAT